MATGFTPIPRCKEGGVSLISAEYANKLIDAINILGAMGIAPIANVGKATFGQPGLILDLSQLDGRLKAVESQVFVNNTPSLSNRVSILENYTVYLNNRMNNASIVANGTCTGNNIAINISLNI